MLSLDPATALLRQTAIVEPGDLRLQQISVASARIVDWEPVIIAAETHGLAPLLHRHLKAAEVDIPARARIMLAGLVARHRQANDTLAETLVDIGEILGSLNLPFVCLKGIALAHIIYPQASLRPMRDIDILVPRDRAVEARDALIAQGYSSREEHAGIANGRYMRHHHHLPEVSRMRHGMQVTIEIHTDALSGDNPEQLCLQSLSSPTRSFTVDDRTFYALGHTDMLTHLVRHALEPAEEIKLGSVCDIVSYAAQFARDIDFEDLDRSRPRLTNALSLMHYVSSLPPSLSALQPSTASPADAGYGMPPLSHLFLQHGYRLKTLQAALQPPAWWLHAYYGLPPQSPRLTGYTRHAGTLAKWLARRVRAGLDRSASEPSLEDSQPIPANSQTQIDATDNR